jgi:hypothetical protein
MASLRMGCQKGGAGRGKMASLRVGLSEKGSWERQDGLPERGVVRKGELGEARWPP